MENKFTILNVMDEDDRTFEGSVVVLGIDADGLNNLINNEIVSHNGEEMDFNAPETLDELANAVRSYGYEVLKVPFVAYDTYTSEAEVVGNDEDGEEE